MSKSFCSASSSLAGSWPVGMMAKWSETLVLSKTRRVGMTRESSSARAAKTGRFETTGPPSSARAMSAHGVPHRGEIILGQVARIGPGIGQGLVLFVERLGELEGAAGGESEAVAGFALEGGEVVEQRRGLARGLFDLR